MYLTLLITVALLLILCWFMHLVTTEKTVEGWQSYSIPPYNYVKTGADPLYVYQRNRYRKPYRYPFKFISSYPYPHQTHLP